MRDQAANYWRGPIQSAEHANKIIGLTAGGFAVIAGLDALTLLDKPRVATVLTVLVLAVPAFALLRTHGIVAARVLLGLSILAMVLAVCAAIYDAAITGTPNIGVFFMLAVGLLWTGVSFACARACKAAKYLRSAPRALAAV
jgi:hypothetical protein